MLVSAQYMDVLLGEGEGRWDSDVHLHSFIKLHKYHIHHSHLLQGAKCWRPVAPLPHPQLPSSYTGRSCGRLVDSSPHPSCSDVTPPQGPHPAAAGQPRPRLLGQHSRSGGSITGQVAFTAAILQTIGWLLGYSLFTWLESQGILQLSTFLTIWGGLFLVTTLTIAVFKTEVADTSHHLGLLDTYKVVWKILRHPLMVPTVLMLLTYKVITTPCSPSSSSSFPQVGFSTAEVVTSLKLVEFGVPRSTVAVLELPMVPVKVVLTLVLSK